MEYKSKDILQTQTEREAMFGRINHALHSSLTLYLDINMDTMRCKVIRFSEEQNNEYPEFPYSEYLKSEVESHIRKEDAPAVLELMSEEHLKEVSADSEGAAEFSVRYRIRRDDNQVRIYESRAHVLRNEVPHHICITTKEVTNEENTRMQLLFYDEALQKVHALFRFNATHNRCEKTERAVFENEEFAKKAEAVTTIDACREAFLPYVMDEKIKEKLKTYLTPENILKTFASGGREIKCQVPYRTEKESYVWIELRAVMIQNPLTGDIEALLSMEQIENHITEKNLLSQVIDNDYDYIVLIDLIHNTARSFSGSGTYEAFLAADAQKYFDDYLKQSYVGDDLEKMLEKNQFSYVQELLKKQNKYEQFYFVKENAGEIRYKKGTYSYPNGDMRYLVYSRVDNTEALQQQQKMGEELKEKQQLLKILNLVPCGITINEITEDGINATYVNDGFYKMLDTKREERGQYQGAGALDSIHPDDVSKVMETAAALVAGEEYGTVNYRLLTGKNTYLWTKLDTVVISREPGKVTIYCAYAEVQTLVETQLELQRNRVLLNAAMESAKVSAWWLDLETNTATLSEIAQKKYNQKHIVKNTPESVIAEGVVDPISINDFREMYAEIFQGKKVSREIKIHHKDTGTASWERLIYTPMFDLDGRLIEAVGTSVDITDEKLQKQLEKAVVAANQANKAKTDFLARMSHDMRTPMNAIIGLTALTLDSAEDPKAVRENLSKMRQASDFLLGLVNDILDMAKIEDGSVQLNMEPYRYSDFLRNMKTMFQPQCEAKGIDITFVESKRNVYGMTDKLRINQIFFNLFSNAVKYTPAGGSIVCKLENVQKEGNRILGDYCITDTGIGMSEQFQRQLFTPFSQESSEVTPELQGSGLGLSITKRLVELMGGTITIESTQGVGTTVRVHLSFELVDDVQDSLAQKDETPKKQGNLTDKRVLLVEDHPLNVEIARKLLEKKHMIVTHAKNGKVAVEMFKASELNGFDVILMDIRMPEMSGLEATRLIRALEREDARTVPIIAMTANAYAEDVQISMEVGMNAHLAKPIDPELMYETIGKALYKK